jgi:hypothetical protein
VKEIDTAEIEQVFERERQPNHPVPEQSRYSFVVMDQLEVTPVVQQGFDSMGTYITGDW